MEVAYKNYLELEYHFTNEMKTDKKDFPINKNFNNNHFTHTTPGTLP